MPLVTLPFQTELQIVGKSSSIRSEIRRELVADEVDEAADGFSQGIESFLLALACEGIDVADPRVACALETAVEAGANYLS